MRYTSTQTVKENILMNLASALASLMRSLILHHTGSKEVMTPVVVAINFITYVGTYLSAVFIFYGCCTFIT